MDKLECKLNYLEEYERLLITERQKLETLQQLSLCERVKLTMEKVELLSIQESKVPDQ